MEKLLVFGSDKCPDCPPALKILDNKEIEYEFINITDSMMNLKKFLKIRDNAEEFKDKKESGSVGIPCFIIGSKITFNIYEII